MIERRVSPSRFTERLSLLMVRVAALGAFIVLLDIKITFVFFDHTLSLGGGFSNDLKGAVIASILISGFAAVKEYWLGASEQGQSQSASLSRIAEAGMPPSGSPQGGPQS